MSGKSARGPAADKVILDEAVAPTVGQTVRFSLRDMPTLPTLSDWKIRSAALEATAASVGFNSLFNEVQGSLQRKQEAAVMADFTLMKQPEIPMHLFDSHTPAAPEMCAVCGKAAAYIGHPEVPTFASTEEADAWMDRWKDSVQRARNSIWGVTHYRVTHHPIPEVT